MRWNWAGVPDGWQVLARLIGSHGDGEAITCEYDEGWRWGACLSPLYPQRRHRVAARRLDHYQVLIAPHGRRVVAVIRAVVFDVGECLVNESHEYGTWADWLDIPSHTFSTVFSATIARGLAARCVGLWT
jgi:hypothetical protein